MRKYLILCVILELMVITGCNLNIVVVGGVPDDQRNLENSFRVSPLILFAIGALELVISTLWTKSVSDGKFLISGVITLVNVLIWCYVIQLFVQELNNMSLVASYAGGCAFGNVTSAYYLKKKRGQL